MHAKSINNPVFQAQYFKELLSEVNINPDLVKDSETCISCHAPIAFITSRKQIISKEEVDPLVVL